MRRSCGSGRGQLFELVDDLLEGLEDLVELDHAGLSSGGKAEGQTMRVRLVGLAGWGSMPLLSLSGLALPTIELRI